MSISPEQAYDVLEPIACTINFDKTIETVEHRADYGDFRITLVPQDFEPVYIDSDDVDEEKIEDPFLGKYHCEVREKLVDVLMKNPKHGDTVREVTFLLKNAIAYSEFD